MAVNPPPIKENIASEETKKASRVWMRWFQLIKDCLDDILERLGVLEMAEPEDFYFEVAAGNITGKSVVHKFGRNDAVGTSYVPVCYGGSYQTPTSAQSLELVSTSANDTAAGSGAQEITVQGLDSSWNLIEETVELNGTSAAALANDYFRVFRGYVTRSGIYATQLAGSHEGDITLQGAGGGDVWLELDDVATFPRGQSQIGAYTIPNGKTGYVKNIFVHVDSNKTANIAFFQRPNADDVTTPYSGAMRLLLEMDGVTGSEAVNPSTPMGGFPAKTDIGFLAKVSTGTGSISVDFEIILVDD